MSKDGSNHTHRVKYKGPGGSVGAYGNVRTGEVVLMTTEEVRYLAKHPDPHLVLLDDIPVPSVTAVPCATPHFDLRTIPWRGALSRHLFKRGRRSINAIVEAMNHAGLDIPRVGDNHTRLHVISSIQRAASENGWLDHDLPELQKLQSAGGPKARPRPRTAAPNPT
jgi:hypothetical protein